MMKMPDIRVLEDPKASRVSLVQFGMRLAQIQLIEDLVKRGHIDAADHITQLQLHFRRRVDG